MTVLRSRGQKGHANTIGSVRMKTIARLRFRNLFSSKFSPCMSPHPALHPPPRAPDSASLVPGVRHARADFVIGDMRYNTTGLVSACALCGTASSQERGLSRRHRIIRRPATFQTRQKKGLAYDGGFSCVRRWKRMVHVFLLRAWY